MKSRSLLTIGLLTVLVLVACTPAAPAQSEAPVPVVSTETEPPAPTYAAPTESLPEQIPTDLPVTEAPTDEPQVVATSRGPDLEATDPTGVSLASGDLQLVEFFRFT